MRLITLNVKGTMAEAQAALQAHGIEFKLAKDLGIGCLSGDNMVQFLVNGDSYCVQVAGWYAQAGNAPFPPGTLLHYRWHEENEPVVISSQPVHFEGKAHERS